MNFTNVFIGDNKNLKLFKGDDVIGFDFTVNASGGTPYDFTGFTDVNLFIYSTDDKTNVLKTILAADLVIAANVITWTSIYASAIDLNVGNYHYKLTYEDATGQIITVSFGVLKVV